MTPLTLLHLRLDCVATETIRLGREQAGERLRNALAAVMLRTGCPQTPRGATPSPAHAAICPVCWLLAAETEPGAVRRAYALVPPLPPHSTLAPGERFSFALTLFGTGATFLPYFVLAVPEMGRGGVGPGRGTFEVAAIWALDPLRGQHEAVLRPGERLVRVPDAVVVDWPAAEEAAQRVVLDERGCLTLRFLTPTRLVDGGLLVKQPDFGVLFRRLLHRLDQLAQQFAGAARRPDEARARLHARADRVRLVESRTRWIDLKSWSGRTKRQTPMGGFVGWARYRSDAWDELLPWLLLGQGAQAGKLTIKGNGAFEVGGTARRYWEWLLSTQSVSQSL